MSTRLAQRIAGLRIGALTSESRATRVDVDPEVLLRIGEAIQEREEIHFDYASSWSWVSLAASLGRFGAEIDAELAEGYARTAR
jgi:hypothetical protein